MSETDPSENISFTEENFDYLIDQDTDSDRIEKELSDIVDHLKEARYDIGSSSFVNLPDDNNILIQYMHQLDEEIETKGILNREVVDRGEIRGRDIYINITCSNISEKKSKIDSIACDFGFDISEEVEDTITINKQTDGEYSDGEYPFRYDAVLILLIFGKIFEQNVEPSELIQSVVSIYEEVEGSVKVDHSADESKEGGELTSDSEDSREEEKKKLSSKKNGGHREKGQSIRSITESARGDLDTDILKKIEADYGLEFFEPDERIQYIGESTWGIRITSDAIDDRLGSANYSVVTDRGIRLVIKSGDDLVDDIVIGYDCIKKIEYNSGITKDSITLHTNEDRTLDVSELNISFQREVSDKQTKEPTIESPAIKFRLRASVQSGTSVDDIVSYIRDRVNGNKRAKISSSTISTYIDKKADERSQQSDERDKHRSDFIKSQKNEGRSQGDDNNSKQSSVSAIAETARGDLDTTILEEIESNYGFGFLQSEEQIQYIGSSMHGVRINPYDKLNGKIISFITDRGVRLVLKNNEDSWDDVVIGYDEIKDIEYNNGFRKESITITTEALSSIGKELKNRWLDAVVGKGSIRSLSIKFRLRSSAHSGSSIEAIVSYMESRIEQLPLENKYDELVSQVADLDYKEISVPSPDSFDSPEKCEKTYDDLDGLIRKWIVSETKFNEIKKYRSKIINQIPGYDRETWMRIIPNIDTPKEFDTADDAISEYRSFQEDFEELESAINDISVIFEHNNLISKYTPERPESEPSTVLEKVTTTVERELNSQRDISEVREDLERIANILTLSSRLADGGGDLPIEPFLQEVIEHFQNEGIPESEVLQEWHEIIQKVETVSTFMDNVDLSHPSIDAEHWEESLEMALEEQYVNVLSPIADQVEKMESGMWELDDLYQISWQEFETLIGTLYESFGYETEVTSDTADMGIDVWATNADERVAVQAKRYQEGNRVGRETLQKLASTLAKGDADRVIVVTTSEFARTAKEYSDSFGSEIELIDGEELRDQLNNSDIPPIN